MARRPETLQSSDKYFCLAPATACVAWLVRPRVLLCMSSGCYLAILILTKNSWHDERHAEQSFCHKAFLFFLFVSGLERKLHKVAQSALKYSLRGAELDSWPAQPAQQEIQEYQQWSHSEVTKSQSSCAGWSVDHSLGAPHQNHH